MINGETINPTEQIIPDINGIGRDLYFLSSKFIGKTSNTKTRNKSTRDTCNNYIINFWSYKIHNRFNI